MSAARNQVLLGLAQEAEEARGQRAVDDTVLAARRRAEDEALAARRRAEDAARARERQDEDEERRSHMDLARNFARR